MFIESPKLIKLIVNNELCTPNILNKANESYTMMTSMLKNESCYVKTLSIKNESF